MVFIPAWKRIGLTLKRPLETSGVDGDDDDAHPALSKRLKLIGVSKTSESSGSFGEFDGHRAQIDPISAQASNIAPDPLQRPLKERKSVTFSPDAKVDDGAAVKLDYSEVKEAEPSSSTASLKKKKKQKPNNVSTDPDGSKDAPNMSHSGGNGENQIFGSSRKPYLKYLDDFHNDKDRWHFNKNRQTQVLQNLFNLYRIPSTYDEALKAYLEGLQGESRIRLKIEAEQVLAESRSASNAKLPSKALDGASELNASAEMTNSDVQERKAIRAQTVLEALKVDKTSTQISPTTKQVPRKIEHSQPSKRSRGRKKRTAIDLEDINTTSSSSESEDENASSSNDESDRSGSSPGSASESSSSSSSSSESSESESSDVEPRSSKNNHANSSTSDDSSSSDSSDDSES